MSTKKTFSETKEAQSI